MIRRALASLTLALMFGATALAQPRLMPLEDLARRPAIASVTVSPDGSQIAYIEMQDGRGAIVVRDLETGTSEMVYRNAQRSISNVSWSADGYWLLTFQDAGGDEGYHLYRLDPRQRGREPVDLTPFAGVQAELIGLPLDRPTVAIITLNQRDPELSDAYEVDLASGALTEVARNDVGFTEFEADARGRVLAGTVTRADGTLDLLTRDAPTSSWRTIYTAPVDERFKLMSLSPNGRTAIVRSNRGRETERLLTLDLTTGHTQVATPNGCGRFDDETVILDQAGLPAFETCIAERATVIGVSSAAIRQIEQVRRLVGSDASLYFEGSTADLQTSVYFSDESDRPGRFILFRDDQASVIAEHRPWLSNETFVASSHHWVSARDGLELSVYVTRPTDAVAGPTVVNLHGGPWARDTGGFEAETQLLVNRGYTVLQVNFRGSTGLGRRHFEAGVRQFGRAMSDDVIDALNWAVEEGMTDPDRVCLMGGSYGGYATLVGLTRDAERFRCGVDFAGPVDLITLVEAFPPSWRPFLPRSWFRFVGDPTVVADRAEMLTRSPLTQVDQITSPLLIFQGANDPRVTQAQSDQIVCALRRRNVPVRYLLATDEGHSFGNEETGLAVNRAVELFLAEYLGGPVQSSVDGSTQPALDSLEKAGLALRCPDAARG